MDYVLFLFYFILFFIYMIMIYSFLRTINTTQSQQIANNCYKWMVEKSFMNIFYMFRSVFEGN